MEKVLRTSPWTASVCGFWSLKHSKSVVSSRWRTSPTEECPWPWKATPQTHFSLSKQISSPQVTQNHLINPFPWVSKFFNPLPSLRTKSHIKGGVPGLPGWRQCLIKGVGRLFHLKALVFLQEIRGWHCWLQPRTLRSHKGPERPWLCVSATTGNKTGALPSSFTNNVQMPN